MITNAEPQSGFYDEADCDLGEFAEITSQSVTSKDVPLAESCESNLPVYDMEKLSGHLTDPKLRRELMAEWARTFHHGAGVVILRKACTDTAAIDEATAVYERIIKREKEANKSGADHFATTGSNDRIWNSLQKLCEEAPEVFVRYFASPAMDAVSEAWLGPNYKMTAQVNVVYPGGQAQEAHRDYHLGFQSADICATYPAHVHELSPLLTLQGGLAHVDVPLESGPTKLLPFSQSYKPGYAAWRRDDFRAHFEENFVHAALSKGDALFFNPALFHAAGENVSKDVHRMVNLFQVNSAFGQIMETIDRVKMCEVAYEPLKKAWDTKQLSELELNAVLASTADGYSFPTNLDKDPPVGGLAPKTQQVLMKECLLAGAPFVEFKAKLAEQEARRTA